MLAVKKQCLNRAAGPERDAAFNFPGSFSAGDDIVDILAGGRDLPGDVGLAEISF